MILTSLQATASGSYWFIKSHKFQVYSIVEQTNGSNGMHCIKHLICFDDIKLATFSDAKHLFKKDDSK